MGNQQKFAYSTAIYTILSICAGIAAALSSPAEEVTGLSLINADTDQVIGCYNLLLAGHALALEVPVITGNLSEFERVPG